MGDSYPQPQDGWTCYFCGERFTTPGAAEDHFGPLPSAKPGCMVKVQAGDERGWLMEIRKAETRSMALRSEVRSLELRLRELQERARTALRALNADDELRDWTLQGGRP